MSVFNIFNMASGEELGRFFASNLDDALDAMARTVGFESYAEARGCLPAMEQQLMVTEL